MTSLQAAGGLTLSLFLAAACATAPAASHPAVLPQGDAGRIAAARDLMRRVRYCALITVDERGQAHARTIDPSAPDARMAVLFATNPATRKVRQLARDPRVTLYYFDERAPGYVTLTGVARMVGDPAAKQRLWLEKWTPFYPGGPGEAVLFEVTPERIEVVDVARGVVGDPQTWMPPSVDMTAPPVRP